MSETQTQKNRDLVFIRILGAKTRSQLFRHQAVDFCFCVCVCVFQVSIINLLFIVLFLLFSHSRFSEKLLVHTQYKILGIAFFLLVFNHTTLSLKSPFANMILFLSPLVCFLYFGAFFYMISMAKSSSEVVSSKYDFNVQLVNAEGQLNNFRIPVFKGQRISDAADDFSRRHNLSVVVLSNKIFKRLCPRLASAPPSPIIVECESQDSNVVVSTLLMHEVIDMSPVEDLVVEMNVYVRKGYSATQQAFFACSYYNCSDATYQRVYEKIAKAMETAAFDVWYDEPFALLEGPSLSHLMTYCLSALQGNTTHFIYRII
jgi:hypothetical protein